MLITETRTPKKEQSIAVVVPSHRRPKLLAACLDGLALQSRPADEVIVVHRSDDHETRAVAEGHPSHPTRVEVELSGVVAALRAGAAFTTADILAFTDDDAVARPDWLARLAATFADRPDVGAVGGRDVLAHDPVADQARVGVFRPFGRLVGSHHKGCGQPGEVDVLKGVNMAVRTSAFAIPGPGVLRGKGAEAHWEIAVCAWARKRHWRIWYDPAILVDHEVGPRVGDQRSQQSKATTAAIAHNMALTTGFYRGQVRQMTWLLLVGRRGNPGIGRAIYALSQWRLSELGQLAPSMLGHARGSLRGLAGELHMIPHDRLRAEAPGYGQRMDQPIA